MNIKKFIKNEFNQKNSDEITNYINRFKQFKRTKHYKSSLKAQQLFDVFFETQSLLIWDGEILFGLRLVKSHHHYTGKSLAWWPLTSNKAICLELNTNRKIK